MSVLHQFRQPDIADHTRKAGHGPSRLDAKMASIAMGIGRRHGNRSEHQAGDHQGQTLPAGQSAPFQQSLPPSIWYTHSPSPATSRKRLALSIARRRGVLEQAKLPMSSFDST